MGQPSFRSRNTSLFNEAIKYYDKEVPLKSIIRLRDLSWIIVKGKHRMKRGYFCLLVSSPHVELLSFPWSLASFGCSTESQKPYLVWFPLIYNHLDASQIYVGHFRDQSVHLMTDLLTISASLPHNPYHNQKISNLSTYISPWFKVDHIFTLFAFTLQVLNQPWNSQVGDYQVLYADISPRIKINRNIVKLKLRKHLYTIH